MTEQEEYERIHQTDAFTKHLGMFIEPEGAHLTKRTQPLGQWLAERTQFNTWPYARALEQAPAPTTRIRSQNDRVVVGYNFGSQDYLGLSQHPAIRDAAISALMEYGPHAAASPMLQGNTTLSRRLEAEITELVNMDHVLLFPTGWAAGFGAIVGLVRSNDHIVIDQLAHSCLMQGARAATPNVRFFRHNDASELRRKLRRIRDKDTRNGILVISEGLFSMDSDSPNIVALQDVCSEYSAVLMMDVAHDLGAQGPGGTGQIGLQRMLGNVDIVMGSFSKTFSSNGGFVATHDLSVKQYLGIYSGSHTYSNAISPVQCAVVLEAMRIVRSVEGDELRALAKANIHQLRDSFKHRGIECLGEPSNVVPVTVGDERLAKWTSRYLEENGLIANLVEYPAVARNRARFRFQVMASHTPEQIDTAIDIFCDSMASARKRVGD
ncbi:MAG: aminotransferase class I/II-fold pyridoxal phosphate-dependent enzyme [Blastocatellia bacterium]